MQCLSILYSKSVSRWVNQCQKSKYILNLAKTIVTLLSVLCIHMMPMRFPFLPFHVSPLVGLLFLDSSTSLLLIRLCSGRPKSDESATSTIQHYIDQQQFTMWNNQTRFHSAGSWGQNRSSDQHVPWHSVLLGSFLKQHMNLLISSVPSVTELRSTSLALFKRKYGSVKGLSVPESTFKMFYW